MCKYCVTPVKKDDKHIYGEVALLVEIEDFLLDGFDIDVVLLGSDLTVIPSVNGVTRSGYEGATKIKYCPMCGRKL